MAATRSRTTNYRFATVEGRAALDGLAVASAP
jgi:hypothetical protein